MSVRERVRAVRLIEKMEKNTAYSEKLGIKNESVFREKKTLSVKEETE